MNYYHTINNDFIREFCQGILDLIRFKNIILFEGENRDVLYVIKLWYFCILLLSKITLLKKSFSFNYVQFWLTHFLIHKLANRDLILRYSALTRDF